MIRVAFDIGGTFTDFVLCDDATGSTHALKVPTSSRNPGEAVIEGLEKLLAATGVSGNSVDVVLHATTVATNAVLERKGAQTGLITTQGFRDVLIIGRQKRYETYDMYIDKPEPLVQRRHIVEVVERVAPDGTVVTALDAESVNRAIDVMLMTGRETIAVSLLHAYARPEHERRIRDRIAACAPELLVSISSEISPKFREYERTNTTVTNAYVKTHRRSLSAPSGPSAQGTGHPQRAVRDAIERWSDLSRSRARLPRSHYRIRAGRGRPHVCRHRQG